MNEQVLVDFPSPIAVYYQESVNTAKSWLDRTNACNRLFEFGIRALVLGILSRYTQDDLVAIYDHNLSQLLQQLKRRELQYWVQVFHAAMNAYHGVRPRFFMQDLYDVYWDTDSQFIALMDQVMERRNLYYIYVQKEPERVDAAFYAETASLSDQLLEKFAFVANYDLLHVNTIYDDNRYQYILYRGVNPHLQTDLITQTVFPGIVYLRNRDGQLLPLNPFFVSYPADFDNARFSTIQTDIGLLNAYLRDDLLAIYNMPISQISAETGKPVPALQHLLDQIPRPEVPAPESVLDWESMRIAAHKISGHQMQNTRKKYDPEIYLNRQAIDNAFQDFLTKPQNAFVLLGKSGVGKSNFVIAQIGEKLAAGEQVAAILVDGGSLTLPDVLHYVFNETRTSLQIGLEEYDGEIFLDLLHDKLGAGGRQILIVIDAINENDSPDNLMTWVNRWALYAHQKQYYWLRFVVTSRPEAWRNIRRMTKINPVAYYRPVDNPELTFELKGFGVQMGEFDIRQELQQVYERYARKYGVITRLETLPVSVRDNLRDPLILKLVMSTYGNEKYPERRYEIAPNISSHTIIEKYIEDLRYEGTVLDADFRLLVETLLPLMCADNRYRNYVTRHDITLHSGDLVEFIFTDTQVLLPDGTTQQVNQSFQNLLNAEILILQRRGGTGYEDEIRFKYERFYDYFVSGFMKADFERIAPAERKSVYIDLSNRLSDTPYLWGPLSGRLIEECVENNSALLQELVWVEDNRIRDLVIHVLIEFGEIGGQDNLGQVKQVCLAILRTIAAQKPAIITSQSIQAGTVAIQVAHHLRLQPVLIQAMLSPHDFVLDAATDVLIDMLRQTEESQDRDLAIAVAIVRDVSKQISIFRFAQFKKTARNLLILCLAVFFLEYKNRTLNPGRWQQITQMLQETLITVLKKVPGLNLGRTLRRLIVRYFANFVIYLVTLLSKREGFIIDLSSISDFFALSPAERQKYRIFVDYINADDSKQTLAVLAQPCRDLIADRQLVASYITTLPIFGAMRSDSDATNQFETDLFEYAFTTLGPTTSSTCLTGSVNLGNHFITLRNTLIEDAAIVPNERKLQNFKHTFMQCEKVFWNRFATTVSEIKWMDIILYYYAADKLGTDIDFQLIRDVIKDRLARPDADETLWHFIHNVIVLGFHPVIFNPELASELMRIMLEEFPVKVIEQNRQVWIESLLLMRAASEYHTDIFLQEAPSNRLSESIKQAVRTGRPNFDISGRVGTAGSWFVRDIMLDKDDTMRKYFQWFFYTALEAKDERDWLLPCLNVVIDGLFTGKFPNLDHLLAPYLKS